MNRLYEVRAQRSLKLDSHLVFTVLVSVFLIFKVIRGFSASESTGGIWNYIQLFCVAVGMMLIILRFNRFTSEAFPFFFLLYTVIALLNSVFFLKVSISSVFGYLTIPFPLCVYAVTLRDTARFIDRKRTLLKISFYVILFLFAESLLRAGTYSTSAGAVSDVYYILGLLPLMIAISGKNKMVPIIAVGIAVLISGKRAGLIIYLLSMLVYGFDKIVLSGNIKSHFKNLVISVFVFVALAVATYYVVSYFNHSFTERFRRMIFESDSSGRLWMWQKILDSYKSGGTVNILLGFGKGSCHDLLGKAGHNDYLQILYEQGVFALSAIVLAMLSLIAEWFSMVRDKYEHRYLYLGAVICSVTLSSVSYFFLSPTYVTCCMISLAYFMADYRIKHRPNSLLLQL